MKHEGIGEEALHSIEVLLTVPIKAIDDVSSAITDLRDKMNKADMLMVLAWTEDREGWELVYETINNEMYKTYGLTFQMWKEGNIHGIVKKDS